MKVGSGAVASPVDEAIRWMLEFGNDVPTDEQARQFELWLAGHPDNQRAWSTLQAGLASCTVASRRPVAKVLLDDRHRRMASRRKVLAGIAGTVGGGAAALSFADRFIPLDNLFAERVTRTAERKRVPMPDGSALVMGPRSALDTGGLIRPRTVNLRSGRIMVDVVDASADFAVEAQEMTLQMDRGRFVMARLRGRVSATAVEGAGRLRISGHGERDLLAGQQVVLDEGRLTEQEADIEVVTAWMDDILIARERTLAWIVEELRPYFQGVIRCASSIETMKATGVFRLDQPYRAIEALASSLNVEVVTIGGYWVNLRPRQV